jgi:hypothetical protein
MARTVYGDDIKELILSRLSQGESLNAICQSSDDMPSHSTVCDWVLSNTQFADKYARARSKGLDVIAEQIVSISDEAAVSAQNEGTGSAEVQAAKLRVDARKWLLSKLRPERYGDRQAIEHSGPAGAPIIVLGAPVKGENS